MGGHCHSFEFAPLSACIATLPSTGLLKEVDDAMGAK